MAEKVTTLAGALECLDECNSVYELTQVVDEVEKQLYADEIDFEDEDWPQFKSAVIRARERIDTAQVYH